MRAIRRVILTRVPTENARLRALLGPVNAELVDLPCLAIARQPLPAPLRERILTGDFEVAMFVSRPSVEHLLDAVPEIAEPKRVVAIGPGTADELIQRGWKVTALPSEPRAEIAAEELESLFPGTGPVLHVRGDLGASLIQNALRKQGREVVEAVVYRNEAPDTPPLDPDPRSTLLVATSPSVLRRALSLIPNADRESLDVLAIGETTARASRKENLPTFVAPETSPAGLVAGIREWLGETAA